MLLKVLPVVLVIAYPILVHASVMLDAPRLALIAFILLVCVGLFRPLAALRVWAWLTLAATSALPFALMRPAGGIYAVRSEEHTSELQSLMRTTYAVFCLKN